MKSSMQFSKSNYVINDIVLALCGLFMLIWPQAALKILCIIIGAILIIMGAVRLITYFREKDTGMNQSSTLPIGVLLVVLGIALIVISRFFVSLLFVLAGLAMLIGCVAMFIRAYHLREVKGQNFIVSIVIGIIVLVLGIVMIINPAGTANFLVQLAGVALILIGLGMLFMRWRESR